MRSSVLLPLIILVLALTQTIGTTSAVAATDTPVLAFYYPWYSPGQFNHNAMWDVPVTPYESDSRATIERQVKEAKGAGITGFISSWLGKGNRTDKNFATLLDVSNALGFSATIYFEAGSGGMSSEGEVVSQLRYVMSTYGSHPSLARVDGKPTLFFWYPQGAGSIETWRSIRSQVDPGHNWHWNVETDRPENWLEVFDGVHLFSAASWMADATATYKNLKTKVDNLSSRYGQQKYFAAGVAPGWDNSRQDNPTQVRVGRQGGDYYSKRWESALACSPALVTVTSWNEWGEGTEIEPGTSYGNLYLDITRRYTASLREGGQATAQSVTSYTGAPGCSFKLGFKLLADRISSVSGQPLENEHGGPNGDSLQQTTSGLMVWRKADNWTAFTDGATTWINGPKGVQSRPNDQRFPWESQ